MKSKMVFVPWRAPAARCGKPYAGVPRKGEQPRVSLRRRGAPAPPYRLGPLSSPPGDEHLLARIELDPVGAMHMQVTVERPLPPREGEKGEGLGHGDVHAHHPRLDALAKRVSSPSV